MSARVAAVAFSASVKTLSVGSDTVAAVPVAAVARALGETVPCCAATFAPVETVPVAATCLVCAVSKAVCAFSVKISLVLIAPGPPAVTAAACVPALASVVGSSALTTPAFNFVVSV